MRAKLKVFKTVAISIATKGLVWPNHRVASEEQHESSRLLTPAGGSILCTFTICM
jgi:hypothetical protein